MLQHLTVENYAIIEKLEIDFKDGLSIITGETGAGKSILLGALGLILGQRADTQVLYDKSRKCIIEAVFSVKAYGQDEFFTANDLDYADLAVLRREINPEGKSRAFINDTPVNLNQMRELTAMLVDIHSQHRSLDIGEKNFQLSVVDDFAGNRELLSEYKTKYRALINLQRELNELISQEQKALADKDYYSFLFNELEQAGLKRNEQSEAETELAALSNAEAIKLNLAKAVDVIYSSDDNIIRRLSEAGSLIEQIARFNKDLEELAQRIKSTGIELKDIVAELENAGQNIMHLPERIQILTERLDLIYHLQQKHHVDSLDQLLDIKDDIDSKLQKISSLDDIIQKLKTRVSLQEKEVIKVGKQLSKTRLEHAPNLEKKLCAILQQLGMPDATLRIPLKPLQSFDANGFETTAFLFSANKGADPKELSRIASGGELSRIMLAVKSVITERSLLPTIIFDEIDSGVSGETAGKVGKLLLDMSVTMQVIAITHLPQIAGKGKQHFYVYKQTEKKRTSTFIRLLSLKEREVEIARMLSGDDYSEAAVTTAKELLGRREK